MLERLFARVRAAREWRRKQAELDDEILFHLSEEEEERVAAGVAEDEARAAARREFGNVALVRETTRETWGWGFVERALQDVRYALRSMRRNPGFSLAVILSLALGIGANTAVFSLMNAVMLRTLPVRDPDRLVIFAHRGDGDATTGSNYPIYETLRTKSQTLSDVLGFWRLPMKLRASGATTSIEGQYVTSNYFAVLGVQPMLGRVFADSDASRDVAIISHGLWQRIFGGSPDVIGRAVVVNGIGLTIVGVHPREFFGMQAGSSVDVSVPFELQRRMSPEFGDRLVERLGTWGLCIVGRLRDGASNEAARSEAEALVAPWVEEVVVRPTGQRGSWARVELLPGRTGLDALRRQFSQSLWMLMAVVALVLLIACANIANLLLARGACRRREIAVRASIGAGRARLVRQLLTESIVLAALGGVAGLVLASWAARLLVVFVSTGPRSLALEVGPDGPVLTFTAAITVITAIACGLAPAFRATRIDLHASLKEHARGSTFSADGSRLRKLLVAGQVAVSLLLLIVAGLFLRSLVNIRGIDPGFDPNRLLLVTFDYLGTGYRGERLAAFYRQSLARIAETPGVRSVGLTSLGPLSGDNATRFFALAHFTPQSPADHVVRANYISPRYFEAMGIPIVEGRPFSARDTAASPSVAILSRSAAQFYFAGRSAVGATFRLGRGASGPSIEIVGVVADIKQQDLRDGPRRTVYLPFDQGTQSNAVIVVRTAGEIPTMAAVLRETLAAVNPDIPVESIDTVGERVDEGLVQERLLAALSSLFGVVAASLAALGLYGVVSYAVTTRTAEIGIRMALGATRRSVAGMILRDAAVVVFGGVVLGAAAAAGLTRVLATMLFGLAPTDPVALAGGTATLLCAAALAAAIPALRASRTDPMAALRDQ